MLKKQKDQIINNTNEAVKALVAEIKVDCGNTMAAYNNLVRKSPQTHPKNIHYTLALPTLKKINGQQYIFELPPDSKKNGLLQSMLESPTSMFCLLFYFLKKPNIYSILKRFYAPSVMVEGLLAISSEVVENNKISANCRYIINEKELKEIHIVLNRIDVLLNKPVYSKPKSTNETLPLIYHQPYEEIFITYADYYTAEFGERKAQTVYKKIQLSSKIDNMIYKSKAQHAVIDHQTILSYINTIPFFIFSTGQTQALGALCALELWNEKANVSYSLLSRSSLKLIAINIIKECVSTFH